MKFNKLVNYVLTENEDAIPIIYANDNEIIYACFALRDYLGEFKRYTPKDDLFEELDIDVTHLSFNNSKRAYDRFVNVIYRSECELTNSEEALDEFSNLLQQNIVPYLHITGQWFAGESCTGWYCIGVKVDVRHYRNMGTIDHMRDAATPEEMDILDW